MTRIPLWFAIILNIILLIAAFSGALTPRGIAILVINTIFTVYALLQWIENVLYRIHSAKTKAEEEHESVIQIIKELMQNVLDETANLHRKVTSLVLLNDLFYHLRNESRHMSKAQKEAWNELSIRFFIANQAKILIFHPDITSDLKDILEILARSEHEFAVVSLESRLERALDNIDETNE